jgi:uncharacterized protein
VNSQATRAAVLEAIRRLGEADFDGCGELLAEDFVQEYPYPPMAGVPERISGRDAFLAFASAGMGAFAPYSFRIVHVHDLVDPASLIVEYTSHTRLLADDTPYSNRYIGVFHVDDDGRIDRWREYLNPDVVRAALRL